MAFLHRKEFQIGSHSWIRTGLPELLNILFPLKKQYNSPILLSIPTYLYKSKFLNGLIVMKDGQPLPVGDLSRVDIRVRSWSWLEFFPKSSLEFIMQPVYRNPDCHSRLGFSKCYQSFQHRLELWKTFLLALKDCITPPHSRSFILRRGNCIEKKAGWISRTSKNTETQGKKYKSE